MNFEIFAHQARSHEHSKLVPIPEFGSIHGDSSGASALASINAFLSTLNINQKGMLLYALDSEERRIWSNLPAAFVPRQGIPLMDLSDDQRGMIFDFLSASLGELGYKRVREVIAAEAFLSNSNPELAERYAWDPQNFYLAIYGNPSEVGQWGWGFGGHHLAINVAIEDNQIESISPSHIGTEPVSFSLDGVSFENMVDTHTVGLNLFESLDADQQERAMGDYTSRDVITGPGNDGLIPQLEGIVASEFNNSQKELLVLAIRKWVEMQPTENVSRRMNEITSDLDGIHFLWAGNENPTGNGYYRIQGPNVIIEHLSFGSERRVGIEQDGHYHTMYRNPNNEYGLGPAEYIEGASEALGPPPGVGPPGGMSRQ